jgi:hypothetical protein
VVVRPSIRLFWGAVPKIRAMSSVHALACGADYRCGLIQTVRADALNAVVSDRASSSLAAINWLRVNWICLLLHMCSPDGPGGASLVWSPLAGSNRRP